MTKKKEATINYELEETIIKQKVVYDNDINFFEITLITFSLTISLIFMMIKIIANPENFLLLFPITMVGITNLYYMGKIVTSTSRINIPIKIKRNIKLTPK